MAASITTLRPKRARLQQAKGAELRQLVLGYPGLEPEVVTRIVAVIDQHTAADRGWSFVMLSPMQNAAVVNAIMEGSARPKLTAKLWALLFTRMRIDTGEIAATRAELADALKTHPKHVSSSLSELEAMGAVIRHQEGRTVQWFMNPRVGTHLSGKAREDAQAAAPQLKLVETAG